LEELKSDRNKPKLRFKRFNSAKRVFKSEIESEIGRLTKEYPTTL